MSRAGSQSKAPARPRPDGNGFEYSDVEDQDAKLGVEVMPDGSAEFWSDSGTDDIVITIHQRDRVALARQLLEGL